MIRENPPADQLEFVQDGEADVELTEVIKSHKNKTYVD